MAATWLLPTLAVSVDEPGQCYFRHTVWFTDYYTIEGNTSFLLVNPMYYIDSTKTYILDECSCVDASSTDYTSPMECRYIANWRSWLIIGPSLVPCVEVSYQGHELTPFGIVVGGTG